MKLLNDEYWENLILCDETIIEAAEIQDTPPLSQIGKVIAMTAINFGKIHDVQIDNVIVIIKTGNITTTARAQGKEQGPEYDKNKYIGMCQNAWETILGMKQDIGL